MLTVKHISLSGKETINSAHHIEYRPINYDDINQLKSRILLFNEAHYVVNEITDGTTFVMNEKGKTVSRYDLGASEVPLEADPKATAK